MDFSTTVVHWENFGLVLSGVNQLTELYSSEIRDVFGQDCLRPEDLF